MIDFQTDINAKFKGTAYMGPHHLVPVYFTVEGASPGAPPFFLQNVAFDPIGKKGEETFEFRSVKESLVAARGEYARFAGRFASPTEMLDWIEKKRLHARRAVRRRQFYRHRHVRKIRGLYGFQRQPARSLGGFPLPDLQCRFARGNRAPRSGSLGEVRGVRLEIELRKKL